VLFGLIVLSIAGCGGSSHHVANCKPHGTHLGITAANLAFDTDCLAAPANQALTITFDNKDAGTPHNVHILTAMDGSTLFKGELITGSKTVTYRVSALQPGTYHFHCDSHPDSMQGTFIVR
jgi:plastocyanin